MSAEPAKFTRSRFELAVAASACLCAVAMCVGALGPWVRTPVLNFSGWAGVGLPLVVLAFVVLAIQALHAFVPRRSWLVLSLLLGALSLVCSIVLALLESILSHTGSLLAFLFTRGTHKGVFGSGHPVSLGWGIPILAAASFLLMVVCIAGLFGRFAQPAIPREIQRFGHRDRLQQTAEPEASKPDDDPFAVG